MNNQGRSVSRRIAAGLLLVLAFVAPAASGQGVSPPFEAALVVADPQTRFEGVLDYDGDGRMDAVSVWFPTTVAITVKGYRNDGAGRLVPDWSVTYSGIQNPSMFFAPVGVLGVGDFNGDGLRDFVLTLNEYVGYWISNGAGVVPTVNWIFPEPAVVDEVVAADFDGDGRTDVALREGVMIRVFVTQSSGPPVLTSSTTVGVVVGSTTHIFATECDGDGLADVGAVNYGTGPFGGTAYVLLFALPGGVIQLPPIQFQFTNVNGPMLVSGDIDGDNDTDVVAFSMPVGMALAKYQVARRVGPTSFTVEPQATGGPATHLVDLDFDGDLDGACCSGGGGGNAINNVVSKFELSINDGTGSFWPAFEIAGMGATHFAGASDLDSDGDIDLIAGRCVYYGGGPSGLPPYPAAQGVIGPRDVADLDGDGDFDGRPGLATFQANHGDGTFGAQTVIAPAPPPGTVWYGPGFPGDFDGDGDVDLLVDTINSPGGVTPNGTRLLRNLGSGAYVDQGPPVPAGMSMTVLTTTFAFPWIGQVAENSLAADLDLDGDQDLVVRGFPGGGSNPGSSRVWINTGGGVFVPGTDLPNILVVHAADMDNDGIVDLVAHQSLSGGAYSALVILKGTPGGYLPPGPAIDNDTHFANRPAILDFDGDGDLDIISMGNLAVKRYTNLGGGTFSAAVPFPGAEPPARSGTLVIPHLAFVTDVDVDGLPDVVTTPLYDAPNGMGILYNSLLNAATPTPGPLVRQIFAPVAFTDLDGDGDEEAIGFVLASRNARYGPAGAGRRVQYGVGIPGSGGITPVLGEVGPFRAGLPGEIRIRGGLGGASGLLAIGPSAANLPMFGGTLLVNATDFFPIQLGGQAGVAGVGGLTIPFVFPAGLAGATIFHQAGFFDGGAVAGVAGTNGLLIEIGP